MNPEYRQFLAIASSKQKENRQLIQQLKRRKTGDLDRLFRNLHELAFKHINCLECANCCITISPSIQDNDIQKISRYLKIKPSAVVSKYMRLDEENDYIMNVAPCPFLMDDNCCYVYDARPLACKGYPHTDNNKMNKLLNLTIKNSTVCPAVSFILEEIKKKNL